MLEDAGKKQDAGYIGEHHESFIAKCLSLKEVLKPLFADDSDSYDYDAVVSLINGHTGTN